MDIKELDDDQLDEHRRDVLTEQERRKKLTDGKTRIGQAIRDYLTAAGEAVPEGDDEALGEAVLASVTERQG